MIDDVFLEICEYLDVRQVISMTQLSKHCCKIIRDRDWHQPIQLPFPKYLLAKLHFKLKHVIVKHCKNITDEDVKHLGGCHNLDLTNTKITDEGVKHLGQCHTLYLYNTNITDEGVKHLGGCHTLYLYNTLITDEGVKHLGRCHTLSLPRQITDEGVKHLGQCHTLDLINTNITDKGVKHLYRCNTLKLQTTRVTKGGVKFLKSKNPDIIIYK